jgi:hypothetical protein
MAENEFQAFFDDLLKQYNEIKNMEFREKLIVWGDRIGRHWKGGDDGTLVEDDVQERFFELLDFQYKRYYDYLCECQEQHTKDELKKMLKTIKGDGRRDIVFHGMYHIIQNATYRSISKLNPQMHEVNKFFISFLGRDEMLTMDHQKEFYLGYTPRSPWFRDYIQNYVSINIDELEYSPLFTFFMCPENLTKYGESHLTEILKIFEDKMQEYYLEHGISIARDCFIKEHEMNAGKLENILNEITRDCENTLRSYNNLPSIGEGYIQETILYQKLKSEFPKLKVIHHGKPLFLGNQHYDVWIPKYKIAVEFQGEQHRRPIEYFGGEAAFIMQKERDERKRQLSIENDVTLFYVEDGYNYSELLQKIKDIIGQS